MQFLCQKVFFIDHEHELTTFVDPPAQSAVNLHPRPGHAPPSRTSYDNTGLRPHHTTTPSRWTLTLQRARPHPLPLPPLRGRPWLRPVRQPRLLKRVLGGMSWLFWEPGAVVGMMERLAREPASSASLLHLLVSVFTYHHWFLWLGTYMCTCIHVHCTIDYIFPYI